MTRVSMLFVAAFALLTGCVAQGVSQTASTSTAQSNSGSTQDPSPASHGASTTEASAQAGAGKSLFENACSSCHDLSLATDKRMSRNMWRETVSDMISQGAPLSNDEANQVIDYLAATYGTN